jgi:hypothetical protein
MLHGGFMDILEALKQEEAKLKKQWDRVRGAIAVLTGAHDLPSGGRTSRSKSTRVKRVVSAALRAHLSRKAKERWARIKAEKRRIKRAK